MSVINKMLQDLEKRQASTNAIGHSAASSHDIKSDKPDSHWRRNLLLFLLGFLSYQLVKYFWFAPDKPMALPQSQSQTQAQISVDSPALAVTETVAPEPTAALPVTLTEPDAWGTPADTMIPAAAQNTAAISSQNGVVQTASAQPFAELPITESSVTEAPVTENPVTESPLTENPLTESLAKRQTLQAQDAALGSEPTTPVAVATSQPQAAAEPQPAANRGAGQQAPTTTQAGSGQLAIEQSRPSYLEQQMSQAAALVAAGQLQQALLELNSPVSASEFPEYLALRAAILQQQQDWPAALSLYQQLLTVEPAHPGWNLAAGIAAAQQGQQALARQYYQQAWLQQQRLAPASQQFLQQQLNQMN